MWIAGWVVWCGRLSCQQIAQQSPNERRTRGSTQITCFSPLVPMAHHLTCTPACCSRGLPPLQRADVVALLDEWAARFFEELDYVREGANATRFAEQIKEDLPQVRLGGWVAG